MRLAGFASKRVMLLLRSTALQQGHKQHSHLFGVYVCKQAHVLQNKNPE